MGMATAAYPCGCRVSQTMANGLIVSVTVCPDHAGFEAVRRGFRLLSSAVEQVNEQLPVNPEPPRAA